MTPPSARWPFVGTGVPRQLDENPGGSVGGDVPVAGLQAMRLPTLSTEPLVSVLVTSYNYGRFIREAINSVLGQPYQKVEVIVCDDASQDDSCAIVEEYAQRDPRVRLIRSPDNRGMAASTNAAFAASSGAIICLLDADDVFCADKITRVVQQFIAEPRAGFLLHSMIVVNATGTTIQPIPLIPAFERGWIAERVIRRGGRLREMPTSALCIRREAAEQVFPMPEPPFRRAADGFVFTLLPLLTEVTAIDEPLARYRVHTENDFGSITRSRESFTTAIGFVEAQIAHVNRRLTTLTGRPNVLNLEHHLAYALHKLLLALLDGSSIRSVRREHGRTFHMLWLDDIYDGWHKAWWLTLLLVATLLPTHSRERWLGSMLGFRRWKMVIRKLGFRQMANPLRRRSGASDAAQ